MIKNCETLDDFAQLIEDSREKPQILLKHSTRCPVSRSAFAEFELFDSKQVNAALWQLSVLENREISDAVSDAAGIVHESPQVIIFFNGKAIWNVSHYDIEVDRMIKAVTELCVR